MKKTVEELYKETGLNCPYLLARCIGLKISHREDLLGACGLYITTYPGTMRIVLNTTYDPETQENACTALLEHHLSHPGIDRLLAIDDLYRLHKEKEKENEFKLRAHFKFFGKSGFLSN